MSKKLLFGRTKKILLFVTLLSGVAASGVFAQSVQPGDIVISEFMADPNATSDSDGEYIELYNRRSFSINIDGFTLSDDGTDSHTIDGTLSIPAGGFVVLARSGSPGFSPDYEFSSYILSNSGDEIVLSDTEGTEIARLNYTSGDVQTTGVSLELNDINNVDVNGQVSSTDYVESQDNIGNGDKGSPGGQGSVSSVAEGPSIKFLNQQESVSEGTGSDIVTVVIEDPGGNPVDVDVVFASSASSAEASDLGESSPVTLTFPGDANDGDQLTAFTLNDDDDFEGAERAVFELSNLTSSGSDSIASPSTNSVTINDNDTPDVVINEFLADPPEGNSGDANGDGTRSADDDEFVEIVNNESTDIDISGWQLSDDGGTTTRHTFPSGTVLPAGRAIVVFGGGEPTGNFGGAIVQTTSSLSLANSSGNVTLLDDQGNIVQDVTYGSEAGNDESITRDNDITGNFTGHTSADSEDDGSAYSPGTKIDGTPFGSDHAIAIRGTEGWRMISSPVQTATFSDLLSEFWMQGVSGSDDPSGDGTLFSWTESGGGSFSPVSDMSDNLSPGEGYIAYFFEDNQFNTPGIQGGFPKIIDSDGTENSGSVSVPVSANDADESTGIDGDEGWNLLGNPFDADLSVTAVLDALESANPSVNSNIYVWDHEGGGGNGAWVSLTDGDLIAPFQAFFVRFTSAFSDNASFNKSSLEANEGKEFYKNVEEPITFNLELHGDQYFDTYSLEFIEDGSTELDRYDAYKLFSLNPNSINLYSTLNNNRLQKNVLPRELETNLEIPLSFDASGRASLTFKWGSFENIPDDWDIILIDNEMNREINLRTGDEYEFTLSAEESEVNELGNSSSKKGMLKIAEQEAGEPRFTLAVQPKVADSEETEIPDSVKLNPNYPNPFNPSTTLSFELAQDAEVTLSIWNMIGQKVATLVEGMVEAGTHQHTWNASNMPSGMYIARLEVGGEVFTRKMTLIK